jgi:predicted nucleic acid-binding protein
VTTYIDSSLRSMDIELLILDDIPETLGVPHDKYKHACENRRETAPTLRFAPYASCRLSASVVADDEDDDRVLECAADGECECVVTGDLLRMGSDERIRILGAWEFRERLTEAD